MSAERAQGGRGWVRIPASRGEQPGRTAPSGTAGAPGTARTAMSGSAATGPSPYGQSSYGQSQYGQSPYEVPGYAAYPPYASPSYGDQSMIYMSLVKRWREAGRTLPGHPDEEWERLISQPCWPGR